MLKIWTLGIVADVNDPEKRRRLRIRIPGESEDKLATDKLPWILPANEDRLPNVNDAVYLIRYDDLILWHRLPDKSKWGDLSDEDYSTAWIDRHNKAYTFTYTKSAGFTYSYDSTVVTDITNYHCEITTDKKQEHFHGYGFEFTNNKCNVGKFDAVVPAAKGPATVEQIQNVYDALANLVDTLKADMNTWVSGLPAISASASTLGVGLTAMFKSTATKLSTVLVTYSAKNKKVAELKSDNVNIS
jgi:hypothetical protein